VDIQVVIHVNEIFAQLREAVAAMDEVISYLIERSGTLNTIVVLAFKALETFLMGAHEK